MDDISFDRLINIQSYSDAELKELAQQLSDEEREVSKRRRILHGEIDIVRAEMVRRLRDKHGTGQGIIEDGEIDTLTAILSGKGGKEAAAAEVEVGEKAGPEEETVAPAGSVNLQGAIQERFRDLSAVSVRDERLLRYISKQVRDGRPLDAIMTDEYILTHTSEATRAQLLENPHVLRIIETEMKKQFASYDPATRPKTDQSHTD